MSEDKKQNNPHSHKVEQGIEDIFRIRRDLGKLRKGLYIAIVFTGVVLVWYGVWTAAKDIWPLSNPAVAIIVGLSLLLVTGKVKDLL